jgi:hypothetical protein
MPFCQQFPPRIGRESTARPFSGSVIDNLLDDLPLLSNNSAGHYWGKTYYFGPWADPDGALKKYLEQRDDLHAGRKPRPDPKAVTVKELVNQFLNAKKVVV